MKNKENKEKNIWEQNHKRNEKEENETTAKELSTTVEPKEYIKNLKERGDKIDSKEYLKLIDDDFEKINKHIQKNMDKNQTEEKGNKYSEFNDDISDYYDKEITDNVLKDGLGNIETKKNTFGIVAKNLKNRQEKDLRNKQEEIISKKLSNSENPKKDFIKAYENDDINTNEYLERLKSNSKETNNIFLKSKLHLFKIAEQNALEKEEIEKANQIRNQIKKIYDENPDLINEIDENEIKDAEGNGVKLSSKEEGNSNKDFEKFSKKEDIENIHEQKELLKKNVDELKEKLKNTEGEEKIKIVKELTNNVQKDIDLGTQERDLKREKNGWLSSSWEQIKKGGEKILSSKLMKEWNGMSKPRKLAWSFALGTTFISAAALTASTGPLGSILLPILGKSAAVRASTMFGALTGGTALGKSSSLAIDMDIKRLKNKEKTFLKNGEYEKAKSTVKAMSSLQNRKTGWIVLWSIIGGAAGGHIGKSLSTELSNIFSSENEHNISKANIENKLSKEIEHSQKPSINKDTNYGQDNSKVIIDTEHQPSSNNDNLKIIDTESQNTPELQKENTEILNSTPNSDQKIPETSISVNKGQGAIKTFNELLEKIKDDNNGKLPENLKGMTGEKMALKYDFWNPNETKDSALIYENDKFGIDKNGELFFERNGKSTILDNFDNQDTIEKGYGGKYFDSNKPKIEIQKMEDSQNSPVHSSANEDYDYGQDNSKVIIDTEHQPSSNNYNNPQTQNSPVHSSANEDYDYGQDNSKVISPESLKDNSINSNNETSTSGEQITNDPKSPIIDLNKPLSTEWKSNVEFSKGTPEPDPSGLLNSENYDEDGEYIGPTKLDILLNNPKLKISNLDIKDFKGIHSSIFINNSTGEAAVFKDGIEYTIRELPGGKSIVGIINGKTGEMNWIEYKNTGEAFKKILK